MRYEIDGNAVFAVVGLLLIDCASNF